MSQHIETQPSNWLSNVKERPMEYIALGGLGVCALVILGLFATTQESEADWERFKADHKCVPVGKLEGSNKGGWYCDDNKVHYRWRQQR